MAPMNEHVGPAYPDVVAEPGWARAVDLACAAWIRPPVPAPSGPAAAQRTAHRTLLPASTWLATNSRT